MCSGFLSQVFAVQTTKLEGIEVNSVGDNISESGIDEGILSKRVAAGPLADKKSFRYALSSKYDLKRGA